MATVPVTRTWVAGEVVTAAHFNTNIRDVLNFLLAPPIFQARQTSAQSIATATATAVTYGTEDVDSAGGHSTVSNTSRYTAVYPGWYRRGAGHCFASNATGLRLDWMRVNATDLNGTLTELAAVGGGAVTAWAGRSKLVFLNVNDYSENVLYQSSGGNLSTSVTTTEQPDFNMSWESN